MPLNGVAGSPVAAAGETTEWPFAPAGNWLAALDLRNGGRDAATLHLNCEPAHRAPAVAAAGGQQCEVVFDGVLYNRDELSQQIGGNLRPDDSDADILLEAYLRWGEETLLRRVKGIFGFCIWDGRSDLLLAVRDPIGIHPLFVAQTTTQFLLSNAVAALVAHPDVPGTVNRAALADHLRHRWVFPEETYYAAVTRVPPAHVLRLERRSGRREVRRYWDPAPLDKKVAWVGEDELDQFDALFDEAINRCLRLGPSGIYLSGGMDSVSVAAVAADNCRRQNLPTPRALSLVFPGTNEDGLNEEDVQRQVAAGLGLPQDLVPFWDAVGGGRGLIQPALEMSSSLAAPMLNTWNPAYQHLSARAAQHGCRVVLTGGGGDEWLTVSPFYAADLVRSFNLAGLFRLNRSMQRSYRFTRLEILRSVLWTFGAKPVLHDARLGMERRLRPLVPGALRERRRARMRAETEQNWLPSWLAPDAALRQEMRERDERVPFPPQSQGYYLSQVRTSIEHPLMTLEMEEIFETSRRMGLRLLQPIWDADLVDFLYRIPPDLLNRGGRSKGMIRDMLARRFPDAGFERHKKIAATGFYRSVLQGEGQGVWRASGGASVLAEQGIVNNSALETASQSWFSGEQTSQMHRIWDLLNTEAWLRPRV